MKMPKVVKRYCPYCQKHTEHRVSIVKTGKRGSLSWGSITRARKRGHRGTGNLGRWGSKPAISQWKRVGKKTVKKYDIRFECKECKKKHNISEGIKVKKLELI
jgi:large subunit ribosomal protein L44e